MESRAEAFEFLLGLIETVAVRLSEGGEVEFVGEIGSLVRVARAVGAPNAKAARGGAALDDALGHSV